MKTLTATITDKLLKKVFRSSDTLMNGKLHPEPIRTHRTVS